jgi:hypothetical protein
VRAGVDQVVPPGELLLDVHVGGIVDRRDPAAVVHVGLHRLALGVGVPDHAAVLEHDHDVERGQVGVVEDGRVLGVHQLEVLVGGQLLEHGDALVDRVVPVRSRGGLGEQQGTELGVGLVPRVSRGGCQPQRAEGGRYQAAEEQQDELRSAHRILTGSGGSGLRGRGSPRTVLRLLSTVKQKS